MMWDMRFGSGELVANLLGNFGAGVAPHPEFDEGTPLENISNLTRTSTSLGWAHSRGEVPLPSRTTSGMTRPTVVIYSTAVIR